MRIVEYVTEEGKSPFESWFLKLNARAAAKVTTALARLENGNTSNVKALVPESMNTRSISDLATESTLGMTARPW